MQRAAGKRVLAEQLGQAPVRIADRLGAALGVAPALLDQQGTDLVPLLVPQVVHAQLDLEPVTSPMNQLFADVPTLAAGIARGEVGKEILVVPMTTPEHVSLIMKSKGIITELGGILSHAAIVCRELKKPCITGVIGATKKLKPGMMIEMNGGTGKIKIL